MVFASYIHIAADNASRAVALVADMAAVDAFVADTAVDIVADGVAGIVVASAVVADQAVVE